METSQNKNTAYTPLRFGQDGFWHENKPHGYESMTGKEREYWDNFIKSTPKAQTLKTVGGTGVGYSAVL